MKTIVHEIPYSPASNLDEEIFTASSVFFDIETTGFSPAHTSLYLIGCAYHIEQMLYIKQFYFAGSGNRYRENTVERIDTRCRR